MAEQDANKTNDTKRIINITMNIELKNEPGNEYQELVNHVTRDAIDAALTATHTLIQPKSKDTSIDNNVMAELRRSLDDKNLQKDKNDNGNASTSRTSTNTTNKCNPRVPDKERKVTNMDTDKGVETDAMKEIRRSLELKKLKKNRNDNSNANSSSGTSENNLTVTKKTKDSKATKNITEDKPSTETKEMRRIRRSLELKNSKKNENDNSDATTSFISSISISGACDKITGTQKAKDTKATNKIANEVNKPTIETEAMRRIRRSLELKNKSNQNNAATTSTSTFSPTTPTSSTCTIQSDEGNGNITRKCIKRKVADLGMDKTHIDTERLKRMKSKQNDGSPRTFANTSEIIYHMDIDDDETVAAPAVTGISSNSNTEETKRETETAGVETEAMRIIRLKLGLDKTSTITSTASPSATRVVNETVISPKAKRKTTVHKATEEMQRVKEPLDQSRKSRTTKDKFSTTLSKTSTKTNANRNLEECLESVPKSNLTPIEYTYELTEDECDETETKNGDSTSSSQLAMSGEVKPDDTPTFIGRMTRSKAWERRVLK